MTKAKKGFIRAAFATLGAAAIGAVGLAGVASADPVDKGPGEEGAPTQGSLTLYKHVEDEDSTSGHPAGDPLEGVEFTVQKVDCIDLTTAEGWVTAEAIFDGGSLPTGCTLTDIEPDTTDAHGKVVFDGLNLGVYYVTETGSGNNIITTKAAPFYVAIPMPVNGQWEYNVVAYPKNVLGSVTSSKTAGDTQLVVGDNVDWTISAVVPKPELEYDSFTITDTLPAGGHLEFVSWGTVQLDGTDLNPGTDYVISADNSTIEFKKPGLEKLSVNGGTVTVVLTTEVVSIPANGIVKNEATITVNGKPQTPFGTVNYGDLLIKKKGAKGNALAGAEFELYDEGDNLLASCTSVATTGLCTFSPEVWVGNDDVISKGGFYIVETKAPAGHVLPADPIVKDNITISAGKSTEAQFEITNHPAEGPKLPLTGASGTLLLTLSGVALITIAGGVYVVTRRKASH